MLDDEWIENPTDEEADEIDRHNHAVEGIQKAMTMFLAALAFSTVAVLAFSAVVSFVRWHLGR